jgi:hypothetical protein
MTRLRHDRHCAEIVAQADLVRSTVAGADLTAPVPTCPGWTSVSCCDISAVPTAGSRASSGPG